MGSLAALVNQAREDANEPSFYKFSAQRSDISKLELGNMGSSSLVLIQIMDCRMESSKQIVYRKFHRFDSSKSLKYPNQILSLTDMLAKTVLHS